jgi:hypothetical protein
MRPRDSDVSGEPTSIVLAGDPGGVTASLMASLSEVARCGLTDWALIGGLAVMARLSESHRVTGDIDTLSRQVDPPPKMALLRVAREETSTGVLLSDGTKVDLIEVAPTLDLAALPDGTGQRMFALAHWWMADTAEEVVLSVVGGERGQVGVVAVERLRLATPAALVAAKLQSIPSRRARALDKRESDAYDVYRLLRADRDGDIARALAGAPGDLGPWCRGAVHDLLVANATRSARWLRNVAGTDPPDSGDLEAVGSLVYEQLTRHLEGR